MKMQKYEDWIFWDLNKIFFNNKKYPEQNTYRNKEEYIHIQTNLTKFINICKKYSDKIIHYDFKNYNIGEFGHPHWGIPREAFEKAFLEFRELQEKYLEKWYDQPDLIKIYQMLNIAFESNLKAHNSRKFWAEQKHFTTKSDILQLCVDYLLDNFIEYEFFSWGIQYDNTLSFPCILYFQFGDDQVSFHSTIEISSKGEDIPEFQGKWCGFHQKKYPFTLKKIKDLCKKTNIEFSELQNSTPWEEIKKEQYNFPKTIEEFNSFYKYPKFEPKNSSIETIILLKREEKDPNQLTIDKFMNMEGI